MKSIVLITCYFGKFPWYFTYFLHSCKYNPGVSFVVVTDNDEQFALPPNVTIVHRTLPEISSLASEKLGFRVMIETPYKMCDFKPAYGFLFPELIDGYDFWGHGDIDVIFGNIRNFITKDLLEQYDFISVRHDYITGHFALFRNCKKMNELFMRSADYRKVFGSLFHYCFDETNFAWEDFRNGVPYYDIKTEIDSMTHVVKRCETQKEITAYFDFHIIEGTPGKLKWDSGTLVYKSRFEAMMYHLIKLKTIYKPGKVPVLVPDNFYISPSRIYFSKNINKN